MITRTPVFIIDGEDYQKVAAIINELKIPWSIEKLNLTTSYICYTSQESKKELQQWAVDIIAAAKLEHKYYPQPYSPESKMKNNTVFPRVILTLVIIFLFALLSGIVMKGL